MSRKKLERFAQNEESPNIIQPGKELFDQIKGNWDRLYFQNGQPIVLELGCGRGEYSVGLARVYPQKNFIGIDIKGARMWKGSQTALEENRSNVAFLRTKIQNLEMFFAQKEVSEIWITFPDPRPRDRDEKRRLTHPRFLEMYRNILKEDGLVHLKTDNEGLFEYTLEVLQNQSIQNLIFTRDLYRSELNNLHFGIKTNYETIFTEKGFAIRYLQFNFV